MRGRKKSKWTGPFKLLLLPGVRRGGAEATARRRGEVGWRETKQHESSSGRYSEGPEVKQTSLHSDSEPNRRLVRPSVRRGHSHQGGTGLRPRAGGSGAYSSY